MNIVITDPRNRIFVPYAQARNRASGRGFGFAGNGGGDGGEERFADGGGERGVGEGEEGEGVGGVVGLVVGCRRVGRGVRERWMLGFGEIIVLLFFLGRAFGGWGCFSCVFGGFVFGRFWNCCGK